MSVLCSIATGSLTAAGTWGLIDSTSYSNSESANATVPTSAGATARSSAFTPGAITIDAIGVKLRTKAASPAGTLTVNLYNSSDSADVSGTSVAINVSDFPTAASATNEGGWVVFKFASPVTLTADKNYVVQCVTSNSSQVTLWTASGNNWSRFLRTTTTQAPTTGDDMIIAGDWTGAGAQNAYTVTMDSTAATDYGSNTTSNVTPALSISKGGTLSYGVSESTNYVLRLSGRLIVYNDGTLNIGSNGAEIPRTSTAILEFDNTTAAGMGLVARSGTVNAYGLSRTVGKDVTWCLLNANAAQNATSLTVDTDTGWLNGDEIVLAPTSQNFSNYELGSLSADAGASSLSVTGFGGAGGGVAFAHAGVAPTQGEVALLTRNVKIRSVSSTNRTFIYSGSSATVNFKWVEFRYLGSTSVTYSIEIKNQSTPFNMSYCSIRNGDYYGIMSTASNSAATTIYKNVFYYIYYSSVVFNDTGQYNVDYNVLIRQTADSYCHLNVSTGVAGSTCTYNRASGSAGYGMVPSPGGNFNYNVSHSNDTHGFYNASAINNVTYTGNKSWRNSSYGLYFASNSYISNATYKDWEIFGNTTHNVNLAANMYGLLKFENCEISADSSFATTNGFYLGGTSNEPQIIDIVNCDLSGTGTGKAAHSVDILLNTAPVSVNCNIRNTRFGASTFCDNTRLGLGWRLTSQNHNQTNGDYRCYFQQGSATSDATIYHTASPSLRLTPLSASVKLESAPKNKGMQVACASGQTVTISVWVRKSVVGDGAAYNGNQPRLVVRQSYEMGYTADTVLDTAAAAAGDWEQLSATTSAASSDGVFEFIVDCDGTAGWVNVDDWLVS